MIERLFVIKNKKGKGNILKTGGGKIMFPADKETKEIINKAPINFVFLCAKYSTTGKDEFEVIKVEENYGYAKVLITYDDIINKIWKERYEDSKLDDGLHIIERVCSCRFCRGIEPINDLIKKLNIQNMGTYKTSGRSPSLILFDKQKYIILDKLPSSCSCKYDEEKKEAVVEAFGKKKTYKNIKKVFSVPDSVHGCWKFVKRQTTFILKKGGDIC